MMIDGLGSVTKELSLAALDAYSLMQRTIATNIAHHSTPGYRPMTVDFEAQFAAVRAAGVNGASDETLSPLIESAASQLRAVQTGETEVHVDAEMSALIQNSIRYQALLTALGKLSSMTRSAINGGQS